MDKIKNWILGVVVVGLIALAIVVWRLPSLDVDSFVKEVQARLGALSLNWPFKRFSIGESFEHWECSPLQQGTSTISSVRGVGTTTPLAWSLNITTGTSTALQIGFATSTVNAATTSLYATFDYASGTNANFIATTTKGITSNGGMVGLDQIANAHNTYYNIKVGGGNDFSGNGSAYKLGGTACIKLKTI